MTVSDDLATLRSTLVEDGWLEHPDSLLSALDRVEAEIAQLVRSRDMYVGQRDEARAQVARLRAVLVALDADDPRPPYVLTPIRAALAEDVSGGREPDGYRIEGGRVIPTDR